MNNGLNEKWNKIIEIRENVLKSLEDARNSRLIGKSLEAKVELKIFQKEVYGLLKSSINDLPAVFYSVSG